MAIDKLDNRNRLLQQMGIIYSQIMDLNEQMTDALQKAVDIDISVTGGVSDITKDFMEGFHYKIDESARVVSEQKKWEYDQLPPVKETELPQIQQDTDIPKRTITQKELNELLHEHEERHEAGNYEILDLSNCIFNGIKFTGNLSDIIFMNSEFNDCIFQNADVENSYLSNAEFTNTVFSECTFDNSILDGAEMGYCAIEYTVYTNCTFNKAAMVACEIESSGMNGCDMTGAVVSDTKFTDVVINNCEGAEYIDFSGVDKDLRNSAETIFTNSQDRFDFFVSDDNVIVRAHSEGYYTEQLFQADYNLDTHKIGKINGTIYDPDILSLKEQSHLNRAADLLRMDILRDMHKIQFDNKEVSRFSPCVMVGTSEVLGLRTDTMYDLKEFSDRLESYRRDKSLDRIINNLSDKVSFTIAFDSGDGRGVRTWKNEYFLRDDKENLIEKMESSNFFNNAEIKYLNNYVSGEMGLVLDTTNTQHQAKEMNAPAEQEAPQRERSENDKHQIAIPTRYAAFVYVKGSNVKTRVTGTSPENIIKMCQKWNTERASDNQLGTAYISKYNSATKKYENFGKYDISNGVELQPIYLELPPVGKQKFGQITSELKANGAKFNPGLKKWYVTQACDLKLFAEYLPKHSGPQINAKGQQDRKKSVLNNLSQNKSNLNENGYKESQPHEQQRKQDAVTR